VSSRCIKTKDQNGTMHHFLRLHIILLLATLVFALSACHKFEGDQTVPAYLRIDTILFTTDYVTQGSNTHNITDAWVYVNDQLIGVYELPATFPVLASGKQDLEIRPGIKLNGIGATRAPYPFYKPFVIDNFNFVEDSVQIVRPVTSYYDNLTFAWTEDFEGSGTSLEKTTASDTIIAKTSPADHPDAWLSPYSSFSGKVQLDAEHEVFQIASFLSYELPDQGKAVLLELDYKCDREFGVGMIANLSSSTLMLPLVVVNKSETWNKIYINLGPNVSAYTTAKNFKIYFESDRGDQDEANFYFDNIKVIYRNISK